jgi:hypothetical protein
MTIKSKKKMMIPISKNEKIYVEQVLTQDPLWLVIYFPWAPTTPKKTAKILTQIGYDVVMPDYVWSYRSDGVFSPEACQRMVDSLWDQAKKWMFGRSYKKTIFVWSSFGWLRSGSANYDSFLLLAPVLQPWLLGKEDYSEDSIEDFIEWIENYYYNVYRGFSAQSWIDFLADYKHMFPSGKKVQILHGDGDQSIHYSRSVAIAWSNKNVLCTIYEWVDHSASVLLQRFIEVQ